MHYKNITTAIFIDRPNRYIANVSINGNTETVHEKKTEGVGNFFYPAQKSILPTSTLKVERPVMIFLPFARIMVC